MQETRQIPSLSLRADVLPDSLDPATRSVDVVWTTGARVRRGGLFTEPFVEELSLSPEHVRMERLNSGRAPVLASHDGQDLDAVVGVVESARLEKGKGVARVRFATGDPDADKAWNKVQQGILRNVSVGYQVHRFEEVGQTADKLPVLRATDWDPHEISLVAMGADAGAHVRTTDPASTHPCVVVRAEKESAMEPIVAADVAPEITPAEPVADAELATAAERKRVLGIRHGCAAVRLSRAFEDKLIADGTSLEEARGLILEAARQVGGDSKGPGTQARGAVVTADPLENVWRGIREAFLHRIDPVTFKLDDNAKQYRSRTLLQTIEECLEQRGVRTRGLSKMELAGLGLGLDRAGMHTTSDFPLILADVANKTLRNAYEAAPQTFAPITKRVPMADFKPVKRNQLGEFPALAKVLEHGEFTRGTITEGKEQFQLATYGKIFGLTRQAIVNDDLNAFGRLATMAGQSARNLESDVVWYQILKNAAMADTVALFHSTHANLAGSNAAIDVTSLGIGRAAMRKQTGLDGVTYLNLSARYLIVPPEKETIADQYTTAITPALGSSVNPFAGRLQVISEPRLAGGVTLDGDLAVGSATAWYLAASMDQAIDMIELGFLDGESGPVVETRVGFDIDGVEFKCRHDVAAKAIDHRGLFKNAGA